MGWSTQFSISSPNMYTRVFSFRRLSMYSCAVIKAILYFLLVLMGHCRPPSNPFRAGFARPELHCPRHRARRVRRAGVRGFSGAASRARRNV